MWIGLPATSVLETDLKVTPPLRKPLIVIGAGPVGLAAAVDARLQGLEVLVLDDDTTIGVQFEVVGGEVAIAEFECLGAAGACSRRNHCEADNSGCLYLHFDRRIASTVEHFAGVNPVNSGHGISGGVRKGGSSHC